MNTDIIESVSGDITDGNIRGKIEALEKEWSEYPQVEIPVVHRYIGGIYAREITIPADTLLTGRIYKDDHFDIMIYGDITVSGEDGKKRLMGFNLFEGFRGKKRAGYAHEETKWITFCKSPKMEDDEYLNALTCETFKEFDSDSINKIEEV